MICAASPEPGHPHEGGRVTDSESADGAWRKSKASNASGECLEVAFADAAVLVRHSHDQTGPVLTFSHAEWRAFLVGARNGEFDLP
jgi:Domain of unknown function (DUF397)